MKANGAYTGNFRDAMEKGEISAEEFNQAIMQLGMTDVAKEAATSTATFEGAMGNLEASAVTAGAKVLDAFKPRRERQSTASAIRSPISSRNARTTARYRRFRTMCRSSAARRST